MTLSPTHESSGTLTPAPTATISIGTAVTAGHGMTLMVTSATSVTNTITSTNGDTWTKVVGHQAGSNSDFAEIWACPSSNGGTFTLTLTAASNASSATTSYDFQEWNGPIVLPTSGGFNGDGSSFSSAYSTGTVTTTANALVMAAYRFDSIAGTTTWDSGWTDTASATSFPTIIKTSYQISSGSGSVSFNGTPPGNNTWTGVIARFTAGTPATPPVANAGPDQTGIEPWSTVTLNGTGSTFTSPDTAVTYAWSQTAGPTATLSSSTAASPTFAAPASLTSQTLTFSLTVTGNNTLVASTSADTVNITVLPSTQAFLSSGGTWSPMKVVAF